jgi:lipopolysaccharide assembly outer membrane protein LptD (OstA)
LNKFNFIFIIIFTVACYADDAIVGKTVITGDEMEITKAGEIANCVGNSKAVNDNNVITSDKMTYDKKKSNILAKGKVKLLLKNQKGEPIESYGDSAEYNVTSQSGKIFGDSASIKYFAENSTAPYVLHAKEINIDRKNRTLKAYNDVEVITSYGTIYSDNGVFDEGNFKVTFKKDKKRPIADVCYDGKTGHFEADKMVFCNKDDNNKITMKGSVTVKIKMKEDIENDTKN